MFCPLCKAEYRPGFTRCADCDVPLVHELSRDQPGPPETATGPGKDLVPIYSTFNAAEVALVKSLLEGEGIAHNFQGELFRGSGVFIVPATLYVTKGDAQRVLEVLRDHGLE